MSDQETTQEAPAKTSTGTSSTSLRRARRGKARHSQRFLALSKGIARGAIHEPLEALELVKKNATAKFDETVEAAIQLGVDPRHGDQMVRGAAVIPHGTGKSRVVWAFARGDKAADAQTAGADLVGAEELIERIQKEGGVAADIVVATPDMMALLGKIGPIIKQKMPNPKSGTVSPNIGEVVSEIKGARRAEFRVDKQGIIHAPIGKASYPVEHLHANLEALLAALFKAKPTAAKGKYLRKIALSSTMGPSIQVDVAAAQKESEAAA